MLLTKILERKIVIQIFGVGLILSPAIVLLQKIIWLLNDSHLTFQSISVWNVITTTPFAYKVLYFANLIIGILVLNGRRHAWKYTLGLLIAYLCVQFTHLRADYRQNKLSLIYPLVNIMASIFIADQLVYKIKSKNNPSSSINKTDSPTSSVRIQSQSQANNHLNLQENVISFRSRKKIMLHLDGLGTWAQLIHVSPQGLKFRGVSKAPQDLFHRKVQFNLKPGLSLQAQLSEHSGNEFLFHFSPLSPTEISLFNEWLQRVGH